MHNFKLCFIFPKLLLNTSDLLLPSKKYYLTSAWTDDVEYVIICWESNTDEWKN